MKEEDRYDKLIDISPYPTIFKLKDFLGGINHWVTVVGKWIFDSNFSFEVPLTKENLDYFRINDNETKGNNGYKGVLKTVMFIPKENNKSFLQKWKLIAHVW